MIYRKNCKSLGAVNIKQKIIISLLLLLGLTLTLNISFVSAADSPNISTQNLQTTQHTTTTTRTTSTYGHAAAGDTTKTVRVLIYSGTGASTNCVTGIETALNSANNYNLVPGYRFTYSTSTYITSSKLSGFDLLAMPGGDGGTVYLNHVSGSAIRNFVSSGHGYLGICAGAYAGSSYVGGSGISYNAWGVAPHVNSKVFNHIGNLLVSMTSSSTQQLGMSGTYTLHHYNGPAMYGSGFVRFANYADNTGGNLGYAAIVGDFYGSGRSVLSGPHPELNPQNPTMVAKLIAWAANVQSTPTNAATLSQIGTASRTVKAHIENNANLPNYVSVAGRQISVPSFLNLLTTAVLKINGGNSSPIAFKTVGSPTAPKGTFKHGTLTKTVYLKITSNIKNYINNYGRAPNYVATSLGNMPYKSAVYLCSKLMSFYSSNLRLPNYVAM